ncbi:MAG: NADP-dependent oxidoreductase [Hyphomicrobiales bacterium]|nr:NADP-dependent oxidoreductase [Hyphomicrobiales bacterium]
MPLNQGFVLASRPQGEARVDNFRYFEKETPPVGPGQVLVRNLWLSLDPYMRGRMDESKSYAASQKLDDVMIGGTAGEVVASENPEFKPGDKVVCVNGGWQTYFLSDGKGVNKVDASRAPLQAFVGPLGMPGVTAWYGLNKIIKPKAGQTVVVSAATGAVGTVVGQLAKAHGARAVGIAGGPEKCAFAVKELGYDACVDHKAVDFAEQFKKATPNGVDGVFENVGGLPFKLASHRLNDFARIAVCGLIASYEGAEKSSLDDLRILLVKRALIEGFIVSDHIDIWGQALRELIDLAASGKLKWRESVVDGVKAAPAAFLGMLKGANFGKQLVKLS